MTHYVLLKFAPGTDLDAAEKRVREAYAALDDALAFLRDPSIHRCCVERDSNMDLMISVTLDEPEQLGTYLSHPLHVAMGRDLNPFLTQRVSFDHL